MIFGLSAAASNIRVTLLNQTVGRLSTMASRSTLLGLVWCLNESDVFGERNYCIHANAAFLSFAASKASRIATSTRGFWFGHHPVGLRSYRLPEELPLGSSSLENPFAELIVRVMEKHGRRH